MTPSKYSSCAVLCDNLQQFRKCLINEVLKFGLKSKFKRTRVSKYSERIRHYYRLLYREKLVYSKYKHIRLHTAGMFYRGLLVGVGKGR